MCVCRIAILGSTSTPHTTLDSNFGAGSSYPCSSCSVFRRVPSRLVVCKPSGVFQEHSKYFLQLVVCEAAVSQQSTSVTQALDTQAQQFADTQHSHSRGLQALGSDECDFYILRLLMRMYNHEGKIAACNEYVLSREEI